MSDEPLGQLASGEYVFDRPRSHMHSGVAPLLPEALAWIESRDRNVIIEEIDLGRIVGKKHCIETTENDRIIFDQRPGRKGLTRFVLDREPEDCSSVSVILKLDDHADIYICLSAYIGTRSEPEPWDAYATPESESFWTNHALVWERLQ